MAFVALSGEAEYAYAWLFWGDDRNAWIRGSAKPLSLRQRWRNGCGINTVPEVGIGKLVILRSRTTVRRIACIIDTYKDSASVKDDIGRE